MARFGPAGNSPSFYQNGRKSSTQVPGWLKGLELSAYEYQCSRGVRISEAQARILGQEARKYDIALSIHAPFYINLASTDPQIITSTRRHLLKSLEAAMWMGASTVVFHPGSGTGNRREALTRAKEALAEVLELSVGMGLEGARLAPETMGKRNQLGSLEEVLELCSLSPRVVPCIDFAHLFAVSGGVLNDQTAFRAILKEVACRLGEETLKSLHIHFSPIEFTAGGEKRHRTLMDEGYGPDFRQLARVMVDLGMEPTVICESFDRQTEDAILYQDYWQVVKGN
ncbi:endonuclease IV [Clostridiales bacterium PH28_bin88]|nr:endonuclease IV [Clostridiales bacterium PH28_bin88]